LAALMAYQPGEDHDRQPARCPYRAARQVHGRRHARRPCVSADAALTGAQAMPRPIPSIAAAVLVLSASIAAQDVRPESPLKPTPDSWLTYHGDYSGQRHSQLKQITPSNVGRLALAWAFQTGQSAPIKATPIVANGIVYVSTPDNLWA